jgi:hypothetical protein
MGMLIREPAPLPGLDDPARAAAFLVEDHQRREVDRLLAEGLLVDVLPGVVAPPGHADDLTFRLEAAALALPPRLRARGAVLAQGAAAWLWCGGPPPSVLDVAVLPGRSVPRHPGVVPHERRMPPEDVRELMPPTGPLLAATTPTRTATDLLRLLPEPLALRAAAPLAATGEVTPEGMAACLQRMGRARGVARARLALGRWPFDGRPGPPRTAEAG